MHRPSGSVPVTRSDQNRFARPALVVVVAGRLPIWRCETLFPAIFSISYHQGKETQRPDDHLEPIRTEGHPLFILSSEIRKLLPLHLQLYYPLNGRQMSENLAVAAVSTDAELMSITKALLLAVSEPRQCCCAQRH